jgi:CheY-like chemotaxis protein
MLPGLEVTMTDGELVEFLVVQDDPADVVISRESFQAHGIVNQPRVAGTVDAALAYLRAPGPSGQTARPDVVVLDVNLPGRDGRHLLRLLRADPLTAEVPVVLLVDSPVGELILRGENLPVQGYTSKPFDFDSLVRVVRSLRHLGFSIDRA